MLMPMDLFSRLCHTLILSYIGSTNTSLFVHILLTQSENGLLEHVILGHIYERSGSQGTRSCQLSPLMTHQESVWYSEIRPRLSQ